jgi:hypothetical protein
MIVRVSARRGNAHLLRVVLLPEEGFPTRPIRGSRGIFGNVNAKGAAGYHKKEMEVVVGVLLAVPRCRKEIALSISSTKYRD